jgi:hypothetical protein
MRLTGLTFRVSIHRRLYLCTGFHVPSARVSWTGVSTANWGYPFARGRGSSREAVLENGFHSSTASCHLRARPTNFTRCTNIRLFLTVNLYPRRLLLHSRGESIISRLGPPSARLVISCCCCCCCCTRRMERVEALWLSVQVFYRPASPRNLIGHSFSNVSVFLAHHGSNKNCKLSTFETSHLPSVERKHISFPNEHLADPFALDMPIEEPVIPGPPPPPIGLRKRSDGMEVRTDWPLYVCGH